MLPADLEELELEAAASPLSVEASGFSCSTAFAAAAAKASSRSLLSSIFLMVFVAYPNWIDLKKEKNI